MKVELQENALSMRKNGNSIKDIARHLGVSQSTISRWCKDVILSTIQKEALDTKRRGAGLVALQPWINKNKELKTSDQLLQKRNGFNDLGTINTRDLFVLGLGLYWGEGYKRGSQECGFTNSDPSIIRIILRWFKECYQVTMDRINARITINETYRNQASLIIKRWSDETGIPLEQFSTPTFISGYGKIAANRDSYRGTLRIKVRRGTSLRRRILASIEKIGA